MLIHTHSVDTAISSSSGGGAGGGVRPVVGPEVLRWCYRWHRHPCRLLRGEGRLRDYCSLPVYTTRSPDVPDTR